MARRFFDGDARPELLSGKTIGVIGYGNQGRAQSLNLRDSGCRVIVGNIDDDYAVRARADGMDLMAIPEAVRQSDILLMLIPDEVQPVLYAREVAPNLKPGAVIAFASGYTIFFGLIDPAPTHDVVMVAPRMLGDFVRTLYLTGEGFPTFVAAHRDVSGQALEIAIALAHAIGGTKVGALEATFEEETVLDLFLEQVLSPAGIAAYMQAFELFTQRYGYDPEVVQLELYGSGEGAQAAEATFRHGLLGSLAYESPTANFGTYTRLTEMLAQSEAAKAEMDKTIREIRDGTFAKIWSRSSVSRERIAPLKEAILKHPIFEVEQRTLAAIFGRREVVCDDERQAVEAAVNAYLEAARQGRSAPLRGVLHPEAASYGVVGGELVIDTAASLLAWLEETGPSPELRGVISSLDIVGSVASAKVMIRNWAQDSYTDVLTLLKTADGWQIVSKAFHLQPG
jgi:ketol-acid reductoisomerase